MALQWVSVDLRTGQFLADLPLLYPDFPLRSSIGRYETASVHLPWRDAPENWLRATQPGAAVLIAYDPADSNQTPQWGGWVVDRTRNTTSDLANLSLTTLESYFDRRYVGDQTFTGISQSQIIKTLVETYVKDGTLPGIPITVTKIDEGTLRYYVYANAEDTTVYQRMTELSGLMGGPEWVVTWSWASGKQFILPTLLVGSRIGSPAGTGTAPQNFEMGPAASPGAVIEAEVSEDYSSGFGANDVTAVASGGVGTFRPTSGPLRAANYLLRPTFEFRWTPEANSSDTTVLASFAQQALNTMVDGMSSTSLSAQTVAAPRYGVDWNLGDDITVSVEHPILGGTLITTARVISVEFHSEHVTPILATSDVQLLTNTSSGPPIIISPFAYYGYGYLGGYGH